MVGFLERLFGKKTPDDTVVKSGKLAKDRLQFVLVQDRIKLPADRLQAMKAEIITVISKYVDVDLDNVDFNLSNRERNGLLIAEIPFIAVAPDEEPLTDDPPDEDATPNPGPTTTD
jgi:cell division topological specificity factor